MCSSVVRVQALRGYVYFIRINCNFHFVNSINKLVYSPFFSFYSLGLMSVVCVEHCFTFQNTMPLLINCLIIMLWSVDSCDYIAHMMQVAVTVEVFVHLQVHKPSFTSVVTIATTPPQIFSGDALTAEDAEDAAAHQALAAILSSNSVQVSSVCHPTAINNN